ncbi:hypothetical protein Cni_G28136 [Canna indica]|uniref:Uncharacterized protein n=1 Tax=Canna indica TaxID=4628 RepID=A0AAQ3L230_9LILI|nr:hypothetical protein Cni_G28136 [Canna indica]
MLSLRFLYSTAPAARTAAASINPAAIAAFFPPLIPPPPPSSVILSATTSVRPSALPDSGAGDGVGAREGAVTGGGDGGEWGFSGDGETGEVGEGADAGGCAGGGRVGPPATGEGEGEILDEARSAEERSSRRTTGMTERSIASGKEDTAVAAMELRPEGSATTDLEQKRWRPSCLCGVYSGRNVGLQLSKDG